MPKQITPIPTSEHKETKQKPEALTTPKELSKITHTPQSTPHHKTTPAPHQELPKQKPVPAPTPVQKIHPKPLPKLESKPTHTPPVTQKIHPKPVVHHTPSHKSVTESPKQPAQP